MSKGGIPDKFLDELREAVKVSTVAESLGLKLQRAGHEYKALSPFNQEKTPSFTINDAKRMFFCFSSGKNGDVFDLFQGVSGCSFPDAVARVAALAGREVPGRMGRKPRPAMEKHGQPEDMGLPEDRSGGAPFNDPIDHLGTDQPPPPKDPPKAKASGKREVVKTYDYLDGDGKMIYQVVRFEPKGFSQRRPDPDRAGKWVWGLTAGTYVRKETGDWVMGGGDRTPDKGFKHERHFPACEHGIYRLPKLLEELALPAGERDPIFLPEGEKDVETLEGWGLLASTNSGGAKNWRPEHAELFRECDVIIPVDCDKPGRERGQQLAESLHGVARRVRVLELPAVEDEHGLQKKGSDVTDWKEKGGGTKDALLKIVAGLPAWAPPSADDFKSKFGAIPMSRLWDQAEPYRWLIKGVVPCNERVMIYGEPQSGKSFMSLDIALCIARGEPFRGVKTAQAGVVYCAFEGGKGFRNRVQGYFRGHEVEPDPATPFVILTRDADLFSSEEAVKELLAEIQHWASTFSVPLGLIVFDTVSACTPGMNENAGEEIGRFLGNAKFIGGETKASIMLVHHKPKNGDTPRGSGKLTGDLETTIEIGFPIDGAHDQNERPIRIMKVKKQREGEAGKEFRFVLRKIEVGRDEDDDAITTCIVEPPGGAERQRESLGFKLRSGNELKLFQALWKALQESGETPPPGTLGADGEAIKPGLKVAKVSEMKRAFMALDVAAEDGEDEEKAKGRMNKAFERGIPSLRKFKIVDSMKPYIWWTGKPIKGMPETHQIGAAAGSQTYRDDDGHEASTVVDPFDLGDENAPF